MAEHLPAHSCSLSTAAVLLDVLSPKLALYLIAAKRSYLSCQRAIISRGKCSYVTVFGVWDWLLCAVIRSRFSQVSVSVVGYTPLVKGISSCCKDLVLSPQISLCDRLHYSNNNYIYDWPWCVKLLNIKYPIIAITTILCLSQSLLLIWYHNKVTVL